MKASFINVICLTILFSGNSFAQRSNIPQDSTINRWKKAVVKLESIQQRYTFAQVDVLLHQQIDTMKGISQHDKYNRQGELLTLRDTIRGTALLVADGNKVYLITAKHLIKATENEGNNLQSINELISIKTNADNKPSNDIYLMNLSTNAIDIRPFVFSSDQNDIGIISFQKSDYKAILAYIKQNGCVPLPVQSIDNINDNNAGDTILTVGFPALPGNTSTNAVVSKGKIRSLNKSLPYFMSEFDVYPGNSGGPVIKNNKLIGILSFQSGILTNIDAAMHPFDKAASAMVIRASVILPLLKELQQNENDPLFR